MATTTVVEATWTPCPLYMSEFERLREENVLDVMKCGLRTGTKLVVERPGRSNAVMKAYNALTADPLNLRHIHDLGRIYASEGQWEKAANVLLRGWKRAAEIEDPKIRFCFLLKLTEASYRIGKQRQAFAILNTIDSPSGKSELLAFQLLACQVYCGVGDVSRALKTFKEALAGRDYRDAVRLLALVVDDLRKAGAFDAVRSAVASLEDAKSMQSELAMVEHYVEARDKADKESKIMIGPKVIIALPIIAAVILIVYLLYLLERWSLQSKNF
eukprot:TRINITY_DN103136_c0_g1_i1.p1 TRINITY_DN103136_c0_g1~~TRINITY_DN103136_c0_g1_i1.p1  ORF type:complete len:272 (+),score=52.54 TRINITY_DN103136_c0_g1_i1:50-865(+)